MAGQETDVVQTPAGADKHGIVKTLGIAVGLFALMLASQLIGPLLACKFMPGLMPGCDRVAAVIAEGAATKDMGPPRYLALEPPLVVSFQDRNAIRFLQVTVEVMTRQEGVMDVVATHSAVIRNSLLMLIGGKTVTELTSRTGKEALRQEALADVQRILTTYTGEGAVEDLYFTSFVVQ